MDQKIEIKPEPVWLEGTASTSFENFEFVSAYSHLKEEPNSELTEPGATQPAADAEDETVKPEETIDRLDPLPKEEDSVDITRIVTESLVLSCDDGEKFNVQMNPQRRSHSTERLHNCTVSGNAHQDRHLPLQLETKQHVCSLCHIRFSVGTHSGEKPFECFQCERIFPKRRSLKLHLRTHSGERLHLCSICERSFSQKSHLRDHLRTHSGEKPFQCFVCKGRFSRKGVLKLHLRTHSGEKPFQCSICEGRFSKKSNLQLHLRTHSGEKPYRCTLCERPFSRKSHLHDHLRTHSGEKRH